MNKKININPSSTKWLEKDDRVVADYFCDLGFRSLKQILDMRVFDLMNMQGLNAVRVEEVIICLYKWLNPNTAIDEAMCPVCAERAVLQGYNDLGTTDPYLLSEWDYEKNSKWTPSNVSRNSMKVVWWKCGAGHSYRAKITDRTIEQKGCPQCEAEFQQALPQMLIMMYGAQNGITVKSNSDSELGMRLVAYLPELHYAVDIAGATVTEKREQSVKAHICQSNRLGYYLIKRTADASQMAAEIKTLFIRNHIYLHTDSEKDVQVLRERFLEWKYRNACKLNGKY